MWQAATAGIGGPAIKYINVYQRISERKMFSRLKTTIVLKKVNLQKNSSAMDFVPRDLTTLSVTSSIDLQD